MSMRIGQEIQEMLWKVNMTDEKKKPAPITNDVFIADIMLRVTAMEKLLIEKGVITLEELTASTEEIARKVAKVVIEKANVSKNVDELLNEIKTASKDKKGLDN